MAQHTKELATYMAEVGKYPVLSRKEERELAKAAKKGNAKARERLIVCNLRFVVQVANQFKAYANTGKYSILDLVQEGNSGLVHAVSKFDYRRGYRFITYAVWWIRAKMMSFIIRSHSIVKLGTTSVERKLFFKMGEIRALLDIPEQERRTRARKRLAKTLGVSSSIIHRMEDRVFWHDTSIDKPIDSHLDTHVSTLKDFLVDEVSLEEQLKRSNLVNKAKDEIESVMKRLTPREAEVIRARYLGAEMQTLQSIAKNYGLSRERIRQIESRAFDKMRPILSKSGPVKEVLAELVNTNTEERRDVTEPE